MWSHFGRYIVSLWLLSFYRMKLFTFVINIFSFFDYIYNCVTYNNIWITFKKQFVYIIEHSYRLKTILSFENIYNNKSLTERRTIFHLLILILVVYLCVFLIYFNVVILRTGIPRSQDNPTIGFADIYLNIGYVFWLIVSAIIDDNWRFIFLHLKWIILSSNSLDLILIGWCSC